MSSSITHDMKSAQPVLMLAPWSYPNAPNVPAKRPLIPESGLPSKKFRCHPCGRGFTTNKALLRHSREDEKHCAEANIPRNLFFCPECPQNFARASGLERHVQEQHGNGKTPCPQCGKIGRANTAHRDSTGQPCTMSMSASRTVISKRTQEQEAAIEFSAPSFDLRPGDWMSSKFEGNSDFQTASLVPQASGGMPDFDWNIRGVRARTCDRMCFENFGTARRAPTERLAEVPMSVHRREIRLSTRPKIPCGICHRNFEVQNQSALYDHLKAHIKELNARHVCSACQIAFAHEMDLRAHLWSAARGYCGFNFKHSTVCTGHHPLSEDGAIHMIFRDAETSITAQLAASNDRDDFVRFVDGWEKTQLRRYAWTTNQLQKVERSPSPVHSAPYTSAPTATNGTGTRSDGANLKWRPGRQFVSAPDQQVVQDLFVKAARNGIIDEVVAALVLGAKINRVDSDGLTALQMAASRQSERMTAELVKRGADPLIFDRVEASPLAIAAHNAQEEIASLLVGAYEGTNVLSTLMVIACSEKDLVSLNVLLSVAPRERGQSDNGLQSKPLARLQRVRQVLRKEGSEHAKCDLIWTRLYRPHGSWSSSHHSADARAPEAQYGTVSAARGLAYDVYEVLHDAIVCECPALAIAILLDRAEDSLPDWPLRAAAFQTACVHEKIEPARLIFDRIAQWQPANMHHLLLDVLNEAVENARLPFAETIVDSWMSACPKVTSAVFREALTMALDHRRLGQLVRLADLCIRRGLEPDNFALDARVLEAATAHLEPGVTAFLGRCLAIVGKRRCGRHSMLCRAATRGSWECVRFLAQCGMNVDEERCPVDTLTALEVADRRQNVGLLDILYSPAGVVLRNREGAVILP